MTYISDQGAGYVAFISRVEYHTVEKCVYLRDYYILMEIKIYTKKDKILNINLVLFHSHSYTKDRSSPLSVSIW